MKKIYLDYAATTPLDQQVIEAMLPFMRQSFGNPSSLHSFGQEARRGIEEAREIIAHSIGAEPNEIIFTSGGTESNNCALKGIAYAQRQKGNHIITSCIEHHSVIEPCKFLKEQGFKITYLKVDEYGMVNPEDVARAITDETILISIMHANNEIGTIQPLSEIGTIAQERGICFHSDGVQTFGHLPLNVCDLGLDMLSVSAHKLCGPKGVGALYVRKGIRIVPLLHGGDQEQKRRASTHNVPGIIGFGKAAQLAVEAMEEELPRLTAYRDRLSEGILTTIPQVRLNGHALSRLANNVNVSIEYIEGESMILSLDMEGIACSTGSACTSSSLKPSHVLLAIGLTPELAHSSLRLTLGRFTQEKDISYVLDVLPKVVARLRSMSPLYTKEVSNGGV